MKKPSLLTLCRSLGAPGLLLALALPAGPLGTAAAAPSGAAADIVVPVGVVGDSDSQSYQDRIWFPPGSPERGGRYRATTFQWTEVLARMRGDRLDLGDWGVWGTNRYLMRAVELFGIAWSRPKKEDYRYNFAMSGSGCQDLVTGPYRQVRRLVELMDSAPERWAHGVVVMRSGVNNFGSRQALEALSRDPDAPVVAEAIDQCLAHYRHAADAIHRRHPGVRVVMVGIFNNAHWLPYLGLWNSVGELRNIDRGLDRFDRGLRQLAAADPGLLFFDDRAWFRSHWGERDGHGKPAFRDVEIAGRWRVRNTGGDDPSNAVLADGHAGLVWNTLWAQSLVGLLNTSAGLALAPITDAEVGAFLAPLLSAAPP